MPRCRHGVVSRRARVASGAITSSFDSIGTVVFDADLNVRRSAASITPRHDEEDDLGQLCPSGRRLEPPRRHVGEDNGP